jgi:micrococcal nuclease
MKKYLLAIAIILPLISGCVIKENADKLVLSAKESLSEPIDYFKVIKVVDGDTFDIDYHGQSERIRLIGLNTPESVDPKKPVECFGKEASEEGKKLLLGKWVRLEIDPAQDDKDKYGRWLRYAITKEGVFYNLEIIKNGFAYEYTHNNIAYQYQAVFKAAQKEAEIAKKGLWSKKANCK